MCSAAPQIYSPHGCLCHFKLLKGLSVSHIMGLPPCLAFWWNFTWHNVFTGVAEIQLLLLVAMHWQAESFDCQAQCSLFPSRHPHFCGQDCQELVFHNNSNDKVVVLCWKPYSDIVSFKLIPAWLAAHNQASWTSSCFTYLSIVLHASSPRNQLTSNSQGFHLASNKK